MSEHRAELEWRLETEAFDYETYNRDHVLEFDNGLRLEASAAPAYKGSPERLDPEEMLVGSIASCHMLTFLAFCSKKRLKLESYRDNAVGVLEKNDQGKLALTRVTLHPVATFAAGVEVSREELEKLHHRAHGECFIANSVRTEVVVELG